MEYCFHFQFLIVFSLSTDIETIHDAIKSWYIVFDI